MAPFRQLKAWQHAKAFAVACITAAKKFPDFEQGKGGLADQLRRAASSAALNIAEGANKGSNKEQRKFFEIGRNSLDEAAAVLDLSVEAGYIDLDMYKIMCDMQSEAARTLFGLLRAVEKRIEAGITTRSSTPPLRTDH